MVTVLSPKGGTGKTTVSTNLAVGLARRHSGEVALADLDLAFGDVAAALLLTVRHGAPALHRGLPMDEVMLRHASGLHVLGAPDEPTPTDTDIADTVTHAIDALAAHYRVVVIDTGAGFDAATRAAVAKATDLVLVASMDVPTLLGLRKVIGWLDGLGHTDARRHLVLNRSNTAHGLLVEDVTATTGLPVAVAIPNDDAVATSVNAGHTITEGDGVGPAAEAFATLVQLLAPTEDAHHRGWLRRFLEQGYR